MIQRKESFMGLSVAFDRFSQFDVFIHLDPFNIKLTKTSLQ